MTSGTAGPSESQRLKDRGAASWAAAVAHPMVAEIGAGTLPHATFRFYFEQNLGYLHEYARAIALTIAGAPDRAAMSVLTRFLGQIVDVEIPANESFLTRLGGAPGTPAPLLPTAYAYTRHLLDVCRQPNLAVALAALLPCQWSYGEIGQRLVQAPAGRPDLRGLDRPVRRGRLRRPGHRVHRPAGLAAAPRPTRPGPRTRSTARPGTRSRSGSWPTPAASPILL